jgi:hypothetical protein
MGMPLALGTFLPVQKGTIYSELIAPVTVNVFTAERRKQDMGKAGRDYI